jgi:hypothetical protein
VAVTEDRAAVAGQVADSIPGASADDVRQSEEFGITSYVVREPAVPGLARVLTLLNS